MEGADIMLLLRDKEELVLKILEIARRQNSFIKNKGFEEVIKLDRDKAAALSGLKAVEDRILKIKPIDEESLKLAENTVKNINLLFNDLINLEKENDSLISAHRESVSGGYIESYKKMSGMGL